MVRSPFVSVFNLSLINAKQQRCSWRSSSRLEGQNIPRHFSYLKIHYRASAAKRPMLCTKLRNVLILIYDQDCWVLIRTPTGKVVHRWPPMIAHSAAFVHAILWSHSTDFLRFRNFATIPLLCFPLHIAFITPSGRPVPPPSPPQSFISHSHVHALCIYLPTYLHWGTLLVAQLVWGTELQDGRSRFRLPMVSLDFVIDVTLPAALRHWGWLSL